ncbi:MAG: hypothetical protein OZ921_10145 [Sorangiineae bacterium]|nr:hypothetical protein [Polyangiaceae bacterium]MEB2322866.1 hypothetical protein [Sorangiineae bacterium]
MHHRIAFAFFIATLAGTLSVAAAARAAPPGVAEAAQQAPPRALPRAAPQPPQPAGTAYGYSQPWTPPRHLPPPGGAASARTRSVWYGWQTLLADAAAVGMFVAAAEVEDHSGVGYVAAGVTYVAVPAAIHVAHGRPWVGAGDAALRVGMPVMLGQVGTNLEQCSRREFFCGLSGFIIGLAVGWSGAVAIDASLLARKTVPEEPRVVILPMAELGRAGVSVAGAF